MPRRRASSWRAFDPGAWARKPPQTSAHVRILGLDPGSRRTGYGLIDCQGAGALHIAHGCIVLGDPSVAQRLRAIFEAVEELIAKHRPDEIAVERVFMSRNADSALKLGQARGAALSAVPRGTAVFEYAPRAVKMAVVGYGAADKRQVAHMMRTLLSLSENLAADASDALAVAVCHAHSRRIHALHGTAGLGGSPE
jgi:crossover junction endodeoxyribonuclease RuvC